MRTRRLARDLYISPLFKAARGWAEAFSDRWFILSAKHGVVSPSTTLAPYDVTLSALSSTERSKWDKHVFDGITRQATPRDRITILAGRKYSSQLIGRLEDRGNLVATPLSTMSIGQRLAWLGRSAGVGVEAPTLEFFYSLLWRLAEHQSGPVRLSDLAGKTLPSRGVYFFLESSESRSFQRRLRVVRVGTHAVSLGSVATLWDRLRTHRGLNAGGGNHRSSIFRTYVGAALIHRDQKEDAFPFWGDQHVRDPAIVGAEAALERAVSDYLSQTSVVWLPIPDDSGAASDRAYVERNSIALLAQTGALLDPSSPDWLGKHAGRLSITRSGLWNVNFVDDEVDADFLPVMDSYVRIALGRRPPSPSSIAPLGWHKRGRHLRGQRAFSWKLEE